MNPARPPGKSGASGRIPTRDLTKDEHRTSRVHEVRQPRSGVRSRIGARPGKFTDVQQAAGPSRRQIRLAEGLHATVVTTSSGTNTDMMALWPNDTNPTHVISCNEQGTTLPGVQRIALATGAVDTIVTGTQSCDPIRTTAWGTIVFGLAFQPGRNNLIVEEDGDQLTGNNDIWDCLPDGTDDDLLSDGCVRIATLNDPTAETTGGIFDASGETYY